MNRVARAEVKYRKLFGDQSSALESSDPEFMAILKRLIFGEVFYLDGLDDATRELITLTVLTAEQALPQIAAHTAAALNIRISPLVIRETVYQCAPFIGFPKTLNAIGAMNEVFRARKITLPLPLQGNAGESDRLEQGRLIQMSLYGDSIRESLLGLPEGFRGVLPDLLSAHCFGDFYTRGGLAIQQRELFVLCLLASLGEKDDLIRSHAIGNIKAGNSKGLLLHALTHSVPYIGLPRAINAIRLVNDILVDA